MIKLSHRGRCLSIPLGAALALCGTTPALASPNVYVGRWTVSDDKPTFSRRGIDYKTIDIAPCGKDYCGVSVGRDGRCGPVMFRFLAKSVKGENGLNGHGRWGDQRKNVELYAYRNKSLRGGRSLNLNLGDGHDFGERSGNMPKFSAGYSPAGAARCTAT